MKWIAKCSIAVAMGTAAAYADATAVVNTFIDNAAMGSDAAVVKKPFGSVEVRLVIDGKTGPDDNRKTTYIEATQRWERNRKEMFLRWTISGHVTQNILEYDDNNHPCRHIVEIEASADYRTPDDGTISDLRVSKNKSLMRFPIFWYENQAPIDYSISESGCNSKGGTAGTYDGGDYDFRFGYFLQAFIQGGGIASRTPSYSEQGTAFAEEVKRSEADGSIEGLGLAGFIEGGWNGNESSGGFETALLDGKTEAIFNKHDQGKSPDDILQGSILVTWLLLGQLQCDGEASGPQWKGRYNDSNRVADLSDEFRPKFQRFLDALHAAGVSPGINQTLRSKESGYLMFNAWRISREGFNPVNVEKLEGVNVCWMHYDDSGVPDPAAAKTAAEAMVVAFQIAFRPAYPDSLHFTGDAVDTTILWNQDFTIVDAGGNPVLITGEPRTAGQSKDEHGRPLPDNDPRKAGNLRLHDVGRTYGVIKLVGDPPHWSKNGG